MTDKDRIDGLKRTLAEAQNVIDAQYEEIKELKAKCEELSKPPEIIMTGGGGCGICGMVNLKEPHICEGRK